MTKNKGYAGKVSRQGAQVVKAPYSGGQAKGGKVTRGEDLRTGKKDK